MAEEMSPGTQKKKSMYTEKKTFDGKLNVEIFY